MKKTSVVLIMIVVLAAMLSAATLPSEQWEYMVVSLGTAYFSDLSSKTMAYWESGISKTIMSASSYERALDILGKQGWEVVSLLGSIGGDQEIVLKRAYDEKRTTAEKKIIDENSKLVLEGLLDSLTSAEPVTESSEPELLELDAYEAKLAREKERAEVEAAITKYLNAASMKPLNITYTWKYTTSNDNGLTVNVKLDVSKCLIKDNQYRKSEVKAMLQTLESYLKAIPVDLKFLAAITLNGYITYSGKSFFVGKLSYPIDREYKNRTYVYTMGTGSFSTSTY